MNSIVEYLNLRRSDMSVLPSEPTRVIHVVAMPYPGRGHINPMLNFCNLLVSKTDNVLVTFVVTKEWLGFIGSDPRPEKIRLSSLPNVIPSEIGRANDTNGFIEAVMTKLEAPFELLLDQLQQPATVIMADSLLFWAVGVGNRRNIPVASFWILSATMFSIFQHFGLLAQKGHYPVDLLERGEERVDYIPGLSSTRLMDFPLIINGSNPSRVQLWFNIMSQVRKAQHLLFSSSYELEHTTFDALRENFSLPIYTVGPTIPFFNLQDRSCISPAQNEVNYIQWLNRQPNYSVLYVSFGSFHLISEAQKDELAAGLRISGVRYLWVVRGEDDNIKEASVDTDMGLLVPWCEQLTVLSHPSIGGFLTHCGWNSVLEGVFSGVPFLNWPLGMDQTTNAKLIEEDWKIGWRVRKEVKVENLVTRDIISELVQKLMDVETNEVKEMRRRVKDLQQMCQDAISEKGSSEINIKSFIRDISQY